MFRTSGRHGRGRRCWRPTKSSSPRCPDLVGLRNAKNLVELLRKARPNDVPPKLVLNQVGVPKRAEIKPAQFAKALDLEPVACVAFEPATFSAAANAGRMIVDAAPRSPATRQFAHVAQNISGRTTGRDRACRPVRVQAPVGRLIAMRRYHAIAARRAAALLRRFGRDCRGSTAMVFALAMPMLIGGLGVGFEISNWYLVQRGMQNAADAAVLAAASNAGANFDVEGKAVAAQFGLVNGVDGVAVTIAQGVTCPTGGATCYSATITKSVPLYLSPAIGFAGSGGGKKDLVATAVASQGTIQRPYCLLALASSGTTNAIRTTGSPQPRSVRLQRQVEYQRQLQRPRSRRRLWRCRRHDAGLRQGPELRHAGHGRSLCRSCRQYPQL